MDDTVDVTTTGVHSTITTSQTSVDELLALGTTEEGVAEVTPVNQPLIIIIWAVGGVLLVLLLAILSRVILSKRKYTSSDDPDCLDNRRFFQPTTFRIMDDSGSPNTHAPNSNGSTSPSSTVPHTNTPDSHRTNAGNQLSASSNIDRQTSSNQTCVTIPERSSLQAERINCQQTLGPLAALTNHTSRSLPTLNGGTSSLQTSGSLATLNGVILSPPPYQQVVNTDARLPSVVVGRYQRETTPTVPPRPNRNASSRTTENVYRNASSRTTENVSPATNHSVSPRTIQRASPRLTQSVYPSANLSVSSVTNQSVTSVTNQRVSSMTNQSVSPRIHSSCSHAVSSEDVPNINTRIASGLVGRSNQRPHRPLPKPRMLFSL